MSEKKKWIAMLLAGGQGSRLSVLTENTAKPAVPFGAKWRIIDFPLSNCVQSGIDTVGILTQYQPLELNRYIGNGQPWGLNRSRGGVHILPPYTKTGKNEWYKGTANAVYQNLAFLERYDPDYVLVLSGDHIYKMDYRKMLSFHKKSGSECTVACRPVPQEERSRMGILSCLESGEITHFEEKPKNPKGELASMGIYLFDRKILTDFLSRDERDASSFHDFGKNIIPAMLKEKRRLFAYPFEDYWKDVGEILALWQANMDLLQPGDPIGLREEGWRVFCRNYAHQSTVFHSGSAALNALVAEGCRLWGKAENSVLSTGCTVEEGAVVCNSVIMPDCTVKKGALVQNAILGKGCVVGEGSVVGQAEQKKSPSAITVVGHGRILPAGSKVLPKEEQ